MEYEVQVRTGNYNPEILLPIWKDALPDLDERRIRWSYKNNPYGQADLFLLNDTDKQNCFGSCIVLPRKYYCIGNELDGGITIDFAIMKEYRSLGPAVKLQKAITASKKYKTLIAFPNNKSVSVQIRSGYTALGNMTRFIKMFRSANVLKRRYNPMVSTLAAPVIDSFAKLKTFKLRTKRFKNYRVDKSVARNLGHVWEEGKSQFDFSGDRSAEYLEWRFVQNPYRTYKIFSADDDNKETSGYIIYYIEDNIVYVDDFFCSNFNRDLEKLFNTFYLHCKAVSIDAVSVRMLENNTMSNFLDVQGFFKEQLDSKVLFFHEQRNILKDRNIFITSGDSDF